MIYIAFLQHPDLKKKKNIDLPTLPIFQAKRAKNLYFCRPYGTPFHMFPHVCTLYKYINYYDFLVNGNVFVLPNTEYMQLVIFWPDLRGGGLHSTNPLSDFQHIFC